MTTKVIPRSELMDVIEIEGTIGKPQILELSHSEIHHTSIADHGDLAVFTDSRAIDVGRRDYISIVLNEDSPILDIKEMGIELDSAYQRFEFTKGGKERG